MMMIVRYGDTVVILAAVVSSDPRPGTDFFPLTVDYRMNDRRRQANCSPAGLSSARARPSTKETLTARMIDRPIRPLFPVWLF